MRDPESGAPELLTLGRAGTARDRSRPSRRTVLLVLAPLLLLATVALGVDLQVRRSEAAGLDRCADRSRAAIHDATARVAGTIAYVRPVWAYKTPPEVRRGLHRMVSKAATGADKPLAAVRRSCAAVEVVGMHTALRGRRAACLRLLDLHAMHLRAVVRDGSRGFGPWPGDDPRC